MTGMDPYWIWAIGVIQLFSAFSTFPCIGMGFCNMVKAIGNSKLMEDIRCKGLSIV